MSKTYSYNLSDELMELLEQEFSVYGLFITRFEKRA